MPRVQPKPEPTGLAVLQEAANMRRRGEVPPDRYLQACHGSRGNDDHACWNGKRPDRPQCGFAGSQNIPVYARAGLADWEWIGRLCQVEAVEGNMGRENGSCSGFYYSGVIGCKALAQRELASAGRDDQAEACRRAIRSSAAWDCMTALPVPRLRDEVNEGGVWRRGNAVKVKQRIAVAVAGNRWTIHEHVLGILSDDSHSQFFASEIATPDELGLNKEERQLMQAALAGDVDAARSVASWMFGTIDTPDTQWQWRLRRTTQGTESIFFGIYPSPYKPVRTVTQQLLDGTHRGMKPSAENVHSNAAGYHVEIDGGGIIRASCDVGSADLAELQGDVIWQVDVHGSEVRFRS